MSNFKEDLNKVKAFVFDVDGVFASTMIISSQGQGRTMNMKDGYAVQYAIKQGYPIAIITGGTSEAVRERFKGLGVTDIYIASHNKLTDFNDFIEINELNPDEILYMGDDIPDYPVMSIVGVPTCPIDAVAEIKNISKYISDIKGGEGCVRDVIEQTLKVQGKWMDAKSFEW